MPGGLRVCPFSVAVFVSTVIYVTHTLRESRKLKERRANCPPCQVVFALGAPGVGKGTQCQLLSTRKGFVHLSAGDLLRAERKRPESELGHEINKCIDAGKLVKSEITCQLIENAMAEAYATSGTTQFLIDGFPRSQGNLDAWNATMSRHHINFVLNFVCPEETLVARLLERGRTSGRKDDTRDVIQQRFRTFRENEKPIIEFYEKSSTSLYTVATDKAVEQVYADTVKYFS